MPSIEHNLQMWDKMYPWPQDGDEWADQARFCGVPYPQWKQQLIETFLAPYVNENTHVLEIAPGHGRWTKELLARAGKVTIVDLGASCIAFCRQKFATAANLTCHVNDGRSLPMLAAETVDFMWSFDSFVHIEPDETASYLAEFARVLKPGGRGCIHHGGNPTPDQRRNGWRSAVTQTLFTTLAIGSGLRVVQQRDSWGEGNLCNTKLFGDVITVFERPPLATPTSA